MSQKDDSENYIWEYKPLEKKRKRNDSPPGTKRRSTSRKTKKQTSVKSDTVSFHNKAAERRDCTTTGNADARIRSKSHDLPVKVFNTKDSTQNDSNAAEEPFEDFCPVCQMPFNILVVQTQRWHIAECLDTLRDKCKECPDGLQCLSTIPNHYQNFNHTLLAHSRANSDTVIITQSQEAAVVPSPSQVNNCMLGESQACSPASSSYSVSPQKSLTGTPPSKPTNGLLLLRSPGPEDLKKKKGWSTKNQKSFVSLQELSSTPVKENTTTEACDSLPEEKSYPEDDEAISYSPLSEFPAEAETKSLFNNDAFTKEDSMTPFDNSFSEDELLEDFIDGNVGTSVPVRDLASSDTHLPSFSSLAHNQEAASSFAANTAKSKEACGHSGNESTNAWTKSPQSLVLEHLKETLQSSQGQFSVQPEQSMPPQKGSKTAGKASGLKQMDIGLFFGLKPLKEKEVGNGPLVLDSSSVPSAGENMGGRRQRRNGQSKRITKTPGDAEPDLSSTRGQQERGGTRGWRRKGWSRVNADGEVQLPSCPFYKKIPGTKFAIDAFKYGKIEGISVYFLTHFHSDHYGGLTKSSTVPIYCNKITGNLVKSKLKVAEEFVHILPMNTEVIVEGVKVCLLDANHCPGAAMLLFFLPDGQTVLHTGDFRADPSMETYPELLGCRVQTLYLDTTYCSPQYTFPRQQEVINFAVNRAFESVTLKPRTLVVCGSYSVGKEKVFLALAEVLGSKVCLSKDKYNTMCCLKSAQIEKKITTDWNGAQVHVLPMMQITFKKLQDHLARFSSQYDQLVAFKPTGWTFSQQVESVDDIQPQISENISIYGIPYSEHSSFLELKRFVQWLRPLKIIPTVNVGSWASRKAMEKCFREWLTEKNCNVESGDLRKS